MAVILKSLNFSWNSTEKFKNYLHELPYVLFIWGIRKIVALGI